VNLLDSRRLTGPNLVWNHPGALLDVTFQDQDAEVVGRWKHEIVLLIQKVGLGEEEHTQPRLSIKRRSKGAWLVVGGRIDQLYGLCDLNEIAWSRAVHYQKEGAALPDSDLTAIRLALDEEANPPLIALQEEASLQGVPFFWDDDEVSLGMGIASQTWPARALPESRSLNWSDFRPIPIAVITGTNGKSTNVRLICHMATAAGLTHGSTSTDWIRVGNEVLDAGDYSGPGGARAVLRDQRVEIAFLETARGGMLRRGVGVQRADVALITNVAEDHMGQYGIHTVADLAEAKMIVQRVVASDGILVLNADDPELVKSAARIPSQNVCWFSLNDQNETMLNQIKLGGSACFVLNGAIEFVPQHAAQLPQRSPQLRTDANSTEPTNEFIANIIDIPMTLEGRAAYNVANSLSATAVALSLGLPLKAVRQGLITFDSTPESNPGRGNYFNVGSLRVLLDYAHNVHGLKAILETTAQLGAKRRILTLSTAGDRTEREIRQMASLSAESGIEEILVTECVGYERELGKGGVSRLLLDELQQHGMRADSFESELLGVEAAFARSRDGDLLILLVKSERSASLDFIQKEINNRLS